MNQIIQNLNNNFPVFQQSLGVMLFGMSGIFIVLLMIYLCIKILLKVFPPEEQQ